MLKDAVKYFDGLNEKHLYELLNTARVVNVTEGSNFGFDNDMLLSVLISGKLSINCGGPEKDVIPGDFIGGASAKGKKITCFAKMDSGCVVIDKKVIPILPKEVISWVAEKSIKIMQENLIAFEKEKNTLSKSLKFFENEYFDKKKKVLNIYKSDLMIQNIIERIPKLPPFTNYLLKKISEDTLSAGDISDYIKTDPAIAGLVLKTVNSAFYSLEKKVTDIHKAVLYLGLDALYQLVMNEALKKVFPEKGLFHEIHKKSSIISFISSVLSEESGKGSPVMLSTAALFRDIGFIARYMLESKNQRLAAIIKDMDVDVLGTVLIESWNFPSDIVELVTWQKAPTLMKPEKISKKLRDSLAILYCSEIVYYILKKDKTNKFKNNPYLESYFEYLGFKNGLNAQKLGLIKTKLIKKSQYSPLIVKDFINEKVKEDKGNGKKRVN